jgi:hypothetical protein
MTSHYRPPKQTLTAALLVCLSLVSLSLSQAFPTTLTDKTTTDTCVCCETKGECSCQTNKTECNQCPTQCRTTTTSPTPTLILTYSKTLTFPSSLSTKRLEEANKKFLVRNKSPEVPPPKI